MSRDPVYDRIDSSLATHGLTFKRLADDEADRVRVMVKALRDRCLLRPDLIDVFQLCDGVVLTLMSNRIDCAVVPRLKALFDEHGIA